MSKARGIPGLLFFLDEYPHGTLPVLSIHIQPLRRFPRGQGGKPSASGAYVRWYVSILPHIAAEKFCVRGLRIPPAQISTSQVHKRAYPSWPWITGKGFFHVARLSRLSTRSVHTAYVSSVKPRGTPPRGKRLASVEKTQPRCGVSREVKAGNRARAERTYVGT